MHLKISSAKWPPFCPGGDKFTPSMQIYHGSGVVRGLISDCMKLVNGGKYSVMVFWILERPNCVISIVMHYPDLVMLLLWNTAPFGCHANRYFSPCVIFFIKKPGNHEAVNLFIQLYFSISLLTRTCKNFIRSRYQSICWAVLDSDIVVWSLVTPECFHRDSRRSAVAWIEHARFFISSGPCF